MSGQPPLSRVLRYYLAACRDGDVVQHRLAPMSIFRRMTRGDLEVVALTPRQERHDHRRRHFLRNDQQRPTAFFDEGENAGQLIDRLYFLIGHQDAGVVENNLHPLDVRHHVMRKIAPLERHAFDHFQHRLDGGAKLDRDDAVIAGALEGFRDDLAEFRVVGRDAGDGSKALYAVEALGRALTTSPPVRPAAGALSCSDALEAGRPVGQRQ
jgi:hypothetical protein